MCQLDIKIQYYTSFLSKDGNVVFNSKAAGTTTISYLLESIKNPKPKLKESIDLIRNEPEKKKRDELKTQLPGFIVQSVGTGVRRRIENITSFTGYTVLDFDGKAVKSYAKELKQFLFDTYKFIVASYLSPSGAVKCIMRIGVAKNIDEYRDYYRAIIEHFEQYDGFDPTPKNPVLIMFYTYDPDILIRTDADVWTTKKPAPPKPLPPPIQPVTDNAEINYRRAYGLVGSVLDKIVDNGHPQLRSAAKLLGGYASRYGLSQFDIENWIHNRIAQHPYLSKGITGYQKTASTFITNGMSEPIDFPD